MTSQPVPEEDPQLLPPEHPLYLTSAQILALSDEEFSWYLRAVEAELQGLGEPIEGSPGELADLITGGTELHPAHLKLIDQAYMDLDAGLIDRLLITMPPQHGKTSRARWGSLHRLQRHHEQRIVVASAELDLAREHTRWVRNTIEGNGRRLGLWTARDRRSARAWDLAGHRGGMYAVGLGGALTGRPADLLVLDDPVKEAKAVEKPEQRQQMWDWWTQVAMTRLSPRASVVVIMTRWHEDDIAGRILASADAGRWRVLHLPALADADGDLLERAPGEPLWPGRYDLAWIEGQRQLLGSRAFAALYQGQPVPAGGTLLKRHWFHVEQDWPRYGTPLRYWDLAATGAEEGGDPDWSVGALVVLDQGRWWVVELERFRASPHELKQRLAAVARRDGRNIPIRAEQEPGSSGKHLMYDLATTVFAGYDFRYAPSTGSKILRASPLAAAAEAGNVTLVEAPDPLGRREPWTETFLAEAESFPYGPHDDQIDAVDGAMAWLTGPVKDERLVQQQRWGHVQSRR